MMPKLRTYIKFKNVFEVEPYVLSFMGRQRRSYLAQLRNGILPLQLEVGRWTNKAVEERLCLICNNGTVTLLNNGPPEERPLINNGQILIALAYFNTFATLKGGHP